MQYLGPDLPGVLATLVFATFIEVCSNDIQALNYRDLKSDVRPEDTVSTLLKRQS